MLKNKYHSLYHIDGFLGWGGSALTYRVRPRQLIRHKHHGIQEEFQLLPDRTYAAKVYYSLRGLDKEVDVLRRQRHKNVVGLADCVVYETKMAQACQKFTLEIVKGWTHHDPGEKECAESRWLENFCHLERTANNDVNVVIMECADRGSLYDYLLKPDSDRSLLMLCRLSIDILMGLEYLHDQMVVHLDIKEDNILLFYETDLFGRKRIVTKIADFDRLRLMGGEKGCMARPYGDTAEERRRLDCWFLGPDLRASLYDGETLARLGPPKPLGCLPRMIPRASDDMWSFGYMLLRMISMDMPRKIDPKSERLSSKAYVSQLLEARPLEPPNNHITMEAILRAGKHNEWTSLTCLWNTVLEPC